MDIRLATIDDGSAMDEIYDYYIRHTVATFAENPVPGESFTEKIEKNGEFYPYYVAQKDGEIIGYAYASPWRYKQAYRFNVELSIYIKTTFHHQGIGEKLYKPLLKTLALQGFKMAYAGITLPNQSSVGLHQKLGFTQVGVFKNTGYKKGKWLDVLWLEKSLNTFDLFPQEPKLVNQTV